jgi:hypothetical protein
VEQGCPGGSRPRRCPRGWWHLLAEARGSQGGYRRHGCARCWRVLWRSLGCPFRKASLVRVLWSLSFLVLPGIRCQNSTQIRDDDAVVRAGRYAATRVNLWMVVGLRFAVTAMDRILTLKLVDGSDGLYDVIALSSDSRSRRVEQLWLSPTVLDRESSGADGMRRGLIGLTTPGSNPQSRY